VICDVPCSGLGVIKKKPEIKLRASKEEAEALPALQLAILENAASCLKPGGRLLYSTCTVIPAENSAVKDKFIKGHPEFELLEESLTLPDETNDDGFYFCVLRKRNGKCRF
jgi:16S rRNA (cytosine967-C5)-methyltransferase